MHSLKMHKPIAESTAVRSPAKLIKSSFNKLLRASWFSIRKTFSTYSLLLAKTYALPTATTGPASSQSRTGAKRRRWDGESTNCLPKAQRSRLRRWVLLAANNRRFYRPLLNKCNCHSVCSLALRESARTRSRFAPHRLVLLVRTLQMARVGVDGRRHGGY